MKICWFGDNQLGLVEGDTVLDVSAALKVLPAPRYPAAKGDPLIANLARVREEIESCRARRQEDLHQGRAFSQPGGDPEQGHWRCL